MDSQEQSTVKMLVLNRTNKKKVKKKKKSKCCFLVTSTEQSGPSDYFKFHDKNP